MMRDQFFAFDNFPTIINYNIIIKDISVFMINNKFINYYLNFDLVKKYYFYIILILYINNMKL